MKKITLQYIAGFFDGDGSIGIYSSKKTKNSFHLRTQLTQNKSEKAKLVMIYLIDKFGGNLSEQITISNDIKYNWQLNADLAVNFLSKILPYLILKKDQADIAINWQRQRPKRIRDKMGRICVKRTKDLNFDIQVARLMKLLKKEDITKVMNNQKDLVKILVELSPLAVIKG